jgi:hypothetical protein
MFCLFVGLFFSFYRHFEQYFSYIMATSFSGGGSRGTWREPPTMSKQLENLRLRVKGTLIYDFSFLSSTIGAPGGSMSYVVGLPNNS